MTRQKLSTTHDVIAAAP